MCTGLRPGEKLYEELLIEAESQPTRHPLIYRANEHSIAPLDLWLQLDHLEEALESQNEEKVLNMLAKLVPEWKSSRE